ncbi:MAG: lipocalin family protein [Owenweeksia sp.]
MRLPSFTTLLIILTVLLSACSGEKALPTVSSVDLERYSGTWYETASLPQEYQKGCECSTARYVPEGDHLRVENRCYDSALKKYRTSEGVARPEKESNNSRLKVRLAPLYSGDYYILALEPDYGYALVGSPDRKSLWILSRSKEPAAEVVKNYLNRAEELGFETSAIVFTNQDCSP